MKREWIRMVAWCWLGLLVVASMPLAPDGGVVGYSMSWRGDEVEVAAGLSRGYVLVMLLAMSGYLLLLRHRAECSGEAAPGIRRRGVALLVDAVTGIFLFAPVDALFALGAEWRRTGMMRWEFTRDYQVEGDLLVMVVSQAFMLLAMVHYFACPMALGRQTPGEVMMGYSVVRDDGARAGYFRALKRVLLGALLLMTWPVTVWLGRDAATGRLWVDKACGTRAVRTR